MTPQTPIVSIVMAAKDTAPYLPDCLDSIIAQTYPHWELIAVNDHSSDSTPEILQTYKSKDSRIKVFHSDRHKLIPTLQVAYSHCQGPLINRMDSDDKMPAYKLQILVDTWKKHGKGHVIAGGTEHFIDGGEVGAGFRRYDQWLNDIAKKQSHYQEIYQECVIPSHCWIIHKEDFDRVGAFDPEIYPEDYDLCFRFYKDGLKVVGLDTVLHFWRDRSDRISRTWDCYQDNRYYDLKLNYFYQLDRDLNRPLVLWGAGGNGKDMAKLLLERERSFHWVCDNPKKIGKSIYGVTLASCDSLPQIRHSQIIVTVASPEGKVEIKKQLAAWDKEPVEDFWFFN